jgi:thiol-disulfide isomerase/thioredoxin
MNRPPRFARRTALGLLATSPLALRARQPAASPSASRQAEVLATAEFTDQQNAAHHLNELTRPLLLVNLWAVWCAACLEEIPTILTLASRLGPDSIDVVLLSHQMNWHADLAYTRHTRLPFRHWRLSSRVPERLVADAFGIEEDRFALPQSLVFAGPERRLVWACRGSRDWAAPEQIRQARGWMDAAGRSTEAPDDLAAQ